METFEECLCRRSGLTVDEVESLLARMTRMEIQKGETLVRKGGRNTNIYIIEKGIWRASYINSGRLAVLVVVLCGQHAVDDNARVDERQYCLRHKSR